MAPHSSVHSFHLTLEVGVDVLDEDSGLVLHSSATGCRSRREAMVQLALDLVDPKPRRLFIPDEVLGERVSRSLGNNRRLYNWLRENKWLEVGGERHRRIAEENLSIFLRTDNWEVESVFEVQRTGNVQDIGVYYVLEPALVELSGFWALDRNDGRPSAFWPFS